MNIDAVKEFFAGSRDEAISMAATHYGVGSGELEVRELPAAAGISGLGDRSCFLIWIAGEEQASAPPRREARDSGSGGGERRDGQRRERSRGGRGRDRDRDRGRGGDRDRDRGSRDRGGERRADRGGERRSDRPEGVDEVRLEAVAREAAERVR